MSYPVPGRLVARHKETRRRFMQLVTAGAGALVAARLPLSATRAQESTPCPPTTTDESIAIAEAYFDAFNTGDPDALGELLAEDYTHHGALVNEQDKAIHQERLVTNRTAFPDSVYELQDTIANGDLVATRWVFTGTLQGPYAGVEPAGQPVTIRGVHIHRIACGQIVETWNNGDGLGLLRQIGALPSPGQSPRTALDAATTPAPASPEACPPDTAEANAEIGRRWTEEVLDSHNLDLYDDFVAEDIIHHAGIFVDEIGRDQLKADLQALIDAFPDVRFTADVIVADEDGAAVRWTGIGTNDGPFQGLEPTGLPVVFTGINVYRIVCGQIVEGWSEPDSLGLLRQLEIVPEIYPGPATPTS